MRAISRNAHTVRFCCDFKSPFLTRTTTNNPSHRGITSMNNKGKTWVTEPQAERPIVVGNEGAAAFPPITVPKWFKQQVDTYAHEVYIYVFFHFKNNNHPYNTIYLVTFFHLF